VTRRTHPRATVTCALVVCALAVWTAGAGAQQPATNLPTVLVSRQVATELGITVNDVVSVAPPDGSRAREFRVAAVYEPTPDPARLGAVIREVRLHLPDLLDLTREPGAVVGTERVQAVNVGLTDPADAGAFARDLNARLPGVLARTTAAAAGSGGPFLVLERFHLAIAIVTIVAATVFLLALTIMLVDERRATVGVLRLIGLPAGRILTQVALEGLLVAGAGAVFGLLLAVGSEQLINRFFQWRYDTALVFVHITPAVALRCVAIAVPLGVVATVLASWALLRRNALRLVRR
jgi:putative ABC transport system permease protein